MRTILFMKSQNFEFLRPENEVLANLAGLAEAVLHIDPGSALTRLRAFAEELTKAIYKEECLPRLPESTLNTMVRDTVFQNCVTKPLVHQLNYLRAQGNETAHGGEGDLRTALMALGTAHQLACYLAIKYYMKKKASIPAFIDIKDNRADAIALSGSINKYKEELDKQKQLNDELLEQIEKERTKNLKYLDAPAFPDQQKRKQESEAVADSLQWNEAKTRKLLIDAMLVQAGWNVSDPDSVGIEVEVAFPNNPSGKGYVDYVLWGSDGKPLAVVEAKRSSSSSDQEGREQARLYANSLEQQFGQRPVIFYTNGYETFIWDDAQYNSPRIVYGFYSKDSLDYLIYQRQYRDNQLEQNNPNLKIADRLYQINAIKSVAHTFQEQRRKALIIQATGTGKTRVSIALADLMLNAGWAKRVLFLCDRKELRTQASEAFKTNLPSEPRCEIGETNKIDENARIYVSTYPGMMNRFAQLDVGFFDLIIADESHRSIYNRYRDIFDYFDALQVGLTATPVTFISRNTFDMFGCETTDPTYQFGLKEAIEHEPPYLVDFKVKDVTTEFLRDGIHYNDLTDAQKRQLEDDLGSDEAQNASYQGKDIGRKIFSEKTDQEILENLMNYGIKDETNSLVGKTIVFANNQKHAEHLEKLFCKLYPQYGNKVCKVIHNKVSHVESLIKEFKKGDNDFRIAISVDMLDTGIDVPEVVNLVFAKTVKSSVKFWQMIGRGTRLCKNLFGKGKDKTEFLIFDHYGNFDFFEQEYKEPQDVGGKPLLQTCFEARVNLAIQALKHNHREGFDSAIELIKADIADLPRDSVAVRKALRQVDTLLQTDSLQKLNATTQHVLSDTIAPLMAVRPLKDKHATQLDRLMAAVETSFIEQSASFEDGRDTLIEQISTLAVNIQAVRQKQAIIDEVNSAEFWQTPSVAKLENARTQLRSIMKFRQSESTAGKDPLKTRTQDGKVVTEVREHKLYNKDEVSVYRRRAKELLDNLVATNPILQKIKAHEAVSEDDLKNLTSTILTTHPTVSLDTLNAFYGRTADQLHITLQELVGLEPEKVSEHFTDFVHRHPNLTSQQVRFMDLLKTYITNYGFIDIAKLYEAPFTSVNPNGVDGVFKDTDVDDLVSVLRPFIKQDVQHDR
ncbi:DEAD/DEAH box helicase family protein [Marinomonas sp. 15G1-11]|uniref:DEAD/DEAH box helicase family protein n=1 Tax=Marinomonas phaeophyticola TaxID=3004091 RepID=A0ABT4JXV5_9GAMM|nr:DEAD/DEAH box helicase family protein [Marinomonas sp. 15G1-11]MCZ2722399.1 DEAD/DEAH box helicase family protein [Marinomonas sp. 15G1-11]